MTRDEFRNSSLVFDERGISLTCCCMQDIPVMRSWEKPFIKEFMHNLIKEHKPKSILEVGFGLGYTADVIQEYGIEHTIIEANIHVFSKAEDWAEGKEVNLYCKFIQDFNSNKTFDLIFDDRYEVVDQSEDWVNNINHKHKHRFHEWQLKSIIQQRKFSL